MRPASRSGVVSFLITSAAFIAAAASAQPPGIRGLGEFQVNVYTSNYQQNAELCQLSSGDFVVVWEQQEEIDGHLSGVFARIFGPDGAPVGGEFQVNAYTTNDQEDPEICCQPDGGFVVVWESGEETPIGSALDGHEDGVFARLFDNSGAPTSGDFQVNTYTLDHQKDPVACCQGGGGFVVVWESGEESGTNEDGDAFGVFGRVFTGTSGGTAFQVNSYTTGEQEDPALCCRPDDTFVVAWESYPQDQSSDGVFARGFSASGTPTSGEFLVNTYTIGPQFNPAICCREDSGFVIAWSDESGLDGSTIGVFGRTFSAPAAPEGSAFQVNAYTTGSQYGPTLCCGPDQEFLVAWTDSTNRDGDEQGVFARGFSGAGTPTPTSGDFQVNVYTTNYQLSPDIACCADGDFMVVWTDLGVDGGDGQDGSESGVFARLFVLPVTILEVPTLGRGGLALFALLVVGAAALVLRRRL